MFTLEVENKNKEIIKLTQNESNFQIINIEGLTPPKAEIVSTKITNLHGERFKSSRIEPREIVLTIKLKGDIEKNRIALYDFFDSGELCTIHYTNRSRKVSIEGYCENAEAGLFDQNQTMQVSIICLDPFLKDFSLIYSDISQTLSSFEFPFAIEKEGIEISQFNKDRIGVVNNRGDVETGAIITITAFSQTVHNPIIGNDSTGQYMRLNLTMNVGDVVVINTNKGNKSVKLISNGLTSNIIGRLGYGSDWFVLKKGQNQIRINTSDGVTSGMKVVFEHRNLFKGV